MIVLDEYSTAIDYYENPLTSLSLRPIKRKAQNNQEG